MRLSNGDIHNSLIRLASCRTVRADVLYWGMWGLTYFHPDSLGDIFHSLVYLTELQIFNKTIDFPARQRIRPRRRIDARLPDPEICRRPRLRMGAGLRPDPRSEDYPARDGYIGTAAARALRPTGCRLIGINRTGRSEAPLDRIATLDALDDILPATDILISTLPLTPFTKGLVDRRRVGLLPEEAGVVVLGRAKVFDYEAIYDRLEKGSLAGAVLEVFPEEPLLARRPDVDRSAPHRVAALQCRRPHDLYRPVHRHLRRQSRALRGRPPAREPRRSLTRLLKDDPSCRPCPPATAERSTALPTLRSARSLPCPWPERVRRAAGRGNTARGLHPHPDRRPYRCQGVAGYMAACSTRRTPGRGRARGCSSRYYPRRERSRTRKRWRRCTQNTFWMGRGGTLTHAMSGIDIALWDILGKVTGLSVGQLLRAPPGASVSPIVRC